jgi:predicted RNA binding protein YcfA (HicA-like mRNA interferase family)
VGKLPKATSRGDFIKRCRQLGFTGPHKGVGDHPEYMSHPDGRVVKVPNPHGKRSDIGEGLLKILLDQAGISVEAWASPTKKTTSTATPKQKPTPS